MSVSCHTAIKVVIYKSVSRQENVNIVLKIDNSNTLTW